MNIATTSALIATAGLSLVPLSLSAQAKPLEENLLLLLDQLPPACTSLEEAKTRCATPDGGCATDAVTASFMQVYQAKMTERTTGVAGMSASQEELMQKMNDPAFQAEMQQMTPDQLVALSMQLQGGALPSAGVPTEEETAMAEEYGRISQITLDEALQYSNEFAQLQSALEERKRAIEQARWAEVEKCPKDVSDVVTTTNRACCAEVEQKYDPQWHTAVAEWLPKANDVVARHMAATKARYGEVEKRMAALGYGDNCTIQMFYDMITTTQSVILGQAEASVKMREQVWMIACENKVGIEQPMVCP